MINSEKQMLSVQRGLRLKALLKENGEKQETIAHTLGYAKESISRFCTGRQLLPDNAAEILAKRWGVRSEYLKCIDDFKTDLEMIDYAEIQNREDFLCQKKYLETLGFCISMIYTLSCSKNAVYRHKEFLLPLLQESSYKAIMNDEDFILPPKEFYRKCFFDNCTLFLKQPLSDDLKALINSFGKSTKISNTLFFATSDESPLGQNTDYGISFEVNYNGQCLGLYSLDSIQQLFCTIDSYTKCSIDIFLSSRRELMTKSGQQNIDIYANSDIFRTF